MRQGDISLAIEIPPGFGRDVLRGRNVEIGAWVDGSMPTRAETVQGYVQVIHQHWLLEKAAGQLGAGGAPMASSIESRYRYNPDVASLPAMVPAVIPLLLLPAMLTALSVVWEKELGSILNLYVTPTTRTEFLIDKQIPYVILTIINFFCMSLLAVTVFGVPVTGYYPTLILVATAFSLNFVIQGLLNVPIEDSITLFLCGAVLCLYAMTALGIYMTTLARTMPQFGLLLMLTLLPMNMLSGGATPRESMPLLLQNIMLLAPTTHFVELGQAILFRGAGLEVVWKPFLALALIGTVLFTLSLEHFRKTITQMA